MSKTKLRLIDALAVVITASLLLLSAGCARSGPKTYPVKGRVDASGDDLQTLAGHTIEFALDVDPNIRAAGQIKDDGSFELETVYGGAIASGALPGNYRARIVLGDDDPIKRNSATKKLHPRYFQFEKSGLALQVPTTESVSLKVLKR